MLAEILLGNHLQFKLKAYIDIVVTNVNKYAFKSLSIIVWSYALEFHCNRLREANGGQRKRTNFMCTYGRRRLHVAAPYVRFSKPFKSKFRKFYAVHAAAAAPATTSASWEAVSQGKCVYITHVGASGSRYYIVYG